MKALELFTKLIRKFFVSLTILLMYSLWFSMWEWIDIEMIPGTEYEAADRGFTLVYFMVTSTFVISVITLILEFVWRPKMFWFKNFLSSLLLSFLVMIILGFEGRVFPVMLMVGSYILC